MSTSAMPSPATAPSPTAAPRRRSPFRSLLRAEARLFAREPVTFLWAVALPLVILAVIGSVPASRRPSGDLDGLRAIDAYVPILVVFSISMLALNAMPPLLASYREKGILRRMSTTPLPPTRVLAAQLLLHAAVGVVSTILVVLLGRVAFGVPLPGAAVGFVLAVVLCGAAMLGLGVAVAAAAPTTRIANAVGAGLFFPLMFFGGLWLPREGMSDVLRHVSDATPVGAAVGALQDASQGDWPTVLALAVLAAWAVGAAALAARLFRWE